MKKFEVRFLTKKEMQNAKEIDPRYEEVDSDNLGFADPQKNRIFVLASKDVELMKYLVSHEMEHLLEDEGTHEDEQGIRHKKGLKFFKDIIAPFSFNPGNIFGGSKGPLANISETAFPIAAGAVNPFLGLGVKAAQSAFGGQQPQQASYQGQASQGGLNSLFPTGVPQQSQQSLGQGFGQQGSFSSPAQGYGGAGPSSLGLYQPGLPQGISSGQGNLPQGANITMGNQAGFFRPDYRF